MIWQLPTILATRIKQHELLGPIFKKMPSVCFDHMMFNMIIRVERGGDINETDQAIIRSRHAKLGITNAIYDAFVHECCQIIDVELQIESSASNRYKDALENMRHLFVCDMEAEKQLLMKEIMIAYNHAKNHTAFADVTTRLIEICGCLLQPDDESSL